MSYDGQPATLHLSVSAATLAASTTSSTALGESVAAARRPVRSPWTRAWSAFIESLDPATLGDDDFDGLLAAAGLVGGSADGSLALPERMAEVNALLDVAAPAMREALLVGLPRPALAAGALTGLRRLSRE